MPARLAAAALLLAAPLQCFAHTFHQSLCEINHNTAAKTYEIILRIHIDDLEVWLTGKHGRQIDLGGMEDTRPLVEPYVRTVFALTGVSGREVVLKWIGAEIALHFIEVYLEAPAEPPPAKLRNEIMTAFLPDQRNWVRIREDNRGPGRSTTLTPKRTTIRLHELAPPSKVPAPQGRDRTGHANLRAMPAVCRGAASGARGWSGILRCGRCEPRPYYPKAFSFSSVRSSHLKTLALWGGTTPAIPVA